MITPLVQVILLFASGVTVIELPASKRLETARKALGLPTISEVCPQGAVCYRHIFLEKGFEPKKGFAVTVILERTKEAMLDDRYATVSIVTLDEGGKPVEKKGRLDEAEERLFLKSIVMSRIFELSDAVRGAGDLERKLARVSFPGGEPWGDGTVSFERFSLINGHENHKLVIRRLQGDKDICAITSNLFRDLLNRGDEDKQRK